MIDGQLPQDQLDFLAHYNYMVSLVSSDVETEEFRLFNDALSAMLNQANRWGQRKAADSLRELAQTAQPRGRAVIELCIERIEKEASE